MSLGPTVKQYGRFRVTDDGASGKKYGVWRQDDAATRRHNDGSIYYTVVGSGMEKDTALTVAEALHKTGAGDPGSQLNESF